MRIALGEALRAIEFPLVDPLRAGGQALAGNPNAVPFYPDNLLLLVGSTLWQLNFHFALHWLIALAGAFWLARAWGLGAEGSIACAVAWAYSGFWYSQLNLYNAVAVVALTPALWASLLEAGRVGARRRGLLVTGVVWALMLLGGDPTLAAIGLGAGFVIVVGRYGATTLWARLAAAILLGSLVALPQIVETLRILPDSMRGSEGFRGLTSGSRSPIAALDILLPFCFGFVEDPASPWRRIFGGHQPLYFSIAPGIVVLTLAVVAGPPRRREARLLAVAAAIAASVAFVAGPAVLRMVATLPGGGLLRFPEKGLLVAALALALAAGCGADRIRERRSAHRAVMAAMSIALVAALLWLTFGVSRIPAHRLFGEFMGSEATADWWSETRLRWAGLSMFAVLIAAATAALSGAGARRPTLGLGALLVLHAGTQAFFLRPLIQTDAAAPYIDEPPAVRYLPAGAVLATVPERNARVRTPSAKTREPEPGARRAWSELSRFAALQEGFPLEFAVSPEGLDDRSTVRTARLLPELDDESLVALFRAIGVERLLAPRALERISRETILPAHRVPGRERDLHVYTVVDPLPEAALAGSIARASRVDSALALFRHPRFRPATTAVIPGPGPSVVAFAGTARLAISEREHVEVEIDSPAGGVLILRRAHLPIWRATIDGVAAPTVIAHLTRLAVEVPPGSHRVVFSISRWPLRISSTVALLALATLVLLWRRDRRLNARGAGSG